MSLNYARRNRLILKLTLLMFIPWIALVFAAPLYNGYYPTVGGWPFLYFYLFIWIFIQPVITFVVYKFVDREAWL